VGDCVSNILEPANPNISPADTPHLFTSYRVRLVVCSIHTGSFFFALFWLVRGCAGCACASSRSPRSLGHNGAIFRPWGGFPCPMFLALVGFFFRRKNIPSLPQCAGCWVPWCCAVVRLRTPNSGSNCSAQYFGLHRDGEVALPHPTGIFFRVAKRDTMSHSGFNFGFFRVAQTA
jgi:hypothetical protein